LAELSGRFLFALDDGRGDLAGVRADVAVRAVDEREALLSVGTRGVRVGWGDVAGLMVAAAEAFLAERDGEEWRIAELEGGEERILRRLGLKATQEFPVASTTIEAGPHGSALVVTVPLGSLTQEQAATLEELAGTGAGAGAGAGSLARSAGVRVTPWRSVVVPYASPERLEGVGLVTTPDSVWSGVTACAGRPGCSKALADVRADARRTMPGMRRDGRRVHWSGCERRCGKPAGEFVDVLAVGNGYLVDGEPM
jgi:precorrin-3B synthase